KSASPARTKSIYEERLGDALPGNTRTSDFVKSKLAALNHSICYQAIVAELTNRRNAHYIPLYFFEYADGHRMITFGGMIGNETDKSKTQMAVSMSQSENYWRTDPENGSVHIRVPVITRKERMYLDQYMPTVDDSWKPKDFSMPYDD